MPKKVHLVQSFPNKKLVSVDVVVDATEDVTVEWYLGDNSNVFARKSATVEPPSTTVEGCYTVTGSSDPHVVTAEAGNVTSQPTTLDLGGLPVQISLGDQAELARKSQQKDR